MSKKNFQNFSKDYKNPRNLVSGLINSKTLKKNIAKYLEFVAYEIIKPRALNSITKLQEFGFKNSKLYYYRFNHHGFFGYYFRRI